MNLGQQRDLWGTVLEEVPEGYIEARRDICHKSTMRL